MENHRRRCLPLVFQREVNSNLPQVPGQDAPDARHQTVPPVHKDRMDLEKTLRDLIFGKRLIAAREKVVIGVSGGIDSTTLLYAMNRIKELVPFAIGIAHVNHQLRGKESERDQAFVEEIAEKLGLPCHVSRVDVTAHARQQGLSSQHAGRELRYRFFDELCKAYGYDRIAIAHNRNDQAETFLLRVIKGTGMHGLSSIPMARGRIIRPLLTTSRSEIESYAVAHAVPHVEDSSNIKNNYERNFVRNRIMPLFEELNSRAAEKIVSLLGDIAGINELLDRKTDDAFDRALRREGKDILFTTDILRDLPEEIRFRVISRILMLLDSRIIPLREHVRLIEKSLLSRRPNNSVDLPHGITVRRDYGSMVFTTQRPTPQHQTVYPIVTGDNKVPELGLTLNVTLKNRGPEEIGRGPCTAFFDAALMGDLTIRTFRTGDRFVPLGMSGSVKLKDYFISRKIPLQKRRSLPLLLSNNDIIWIIGERIDDRFKVTDKTRRFLAVAAQFSL
jgi:tRNA(Ile)-lysidine synthase